MATRRGDHFYVVVNGATKQGDIDYLSERLPRTVVLDHMKEQALLALQGPKAVDALARLAPGVEQLGFMTGGAFELGGVDRLDQPLGLYRRGRLRNLGPRRPGRGDRRAARRPARGEADRPRRAQFAAARGGAAALRPRSRHRRPRRSRPDLGFAVSKRRRAEGGFAGWHRIIREIEEGPVRRRVGLAVEGRQPVREGAMVVDADGNEVGKVTSGGFSPMLEAPIAMAYVPAASAEPRHRDPSSSSAARSSRRRWSPMPFVPHRYHRKGAA